MNRNLHPRILPLILTILVALIQNSALSQNDTQYETCRQPFRCGVVTGIGYPFWGGNRSLSCGRPGFELDCSISSASYRVLSIDQPTRTLRVSRADLWNNSCPSFLSNTTLDFARFRFSPIAGYQNVTLYYGCSISQAPAAAPAPATASLNRSGVWNGVICRSSIYVPMNRTAATALVTPATASVGLLRAAIASGFPIQWTADDGECDGCVRSGGVCGYDQSSTSFVCHCSDRPHESTCGAGSKHGHSDVQKYVIIGIPLGIAGIVTSFAIIFYIKKHHRLQKKDQESNRNVDKFLLNHGSLAPKRYTYKEIKKITKSFSDKLGQGGFGTVYKGMLPDGELVAVKVLTGTNDDGEEFINEVVTISRTSHVNIVNLLGFCYDRKRRALVYEFMPNKSLDKFIYQNEPDSRLDSQTMFEIAVGVGRGLEYLHIGCNTRIVHFDIKPHNVLLDEDFCPKISDFGLAKLFKKKQSMLSMLGARGTAGYIAPEVFSRTFGGVSHKSDVYSYGMMLLEMAGGRNITGIEGIRSSETDFPDKIYEHVLLENERLDDSMIREEEETVRKMMVVGLWCIQIAPSDRPSMTKVVEMLEGHIWSIPIPPKPTLFTPKLSVAQFSSLVSKNADTPNSSEGNFVGLGTQAFS